MGTTWVTYTCQFMTNKSSPDTERDDWRGMTPCDRGLTTPMVDDVFALLADWRRRAVCRYFTTTGTSSAHVDTLAAAVARRKTTGNVSPSETCEDEIRDALVDVHLPRLDEAGVLDFDDRSDSVRYWGHATVEKWAEHADAVEQR